MKPYTFKHAVKAIVSFGEYADARRLRDVVRQDCLTSLDVSNPETEFIKFAILAGPNSPDRAKYVNSKRFSAMRTKWLDTYLTAIGEYSCRWCKVGRTMPWSKGTSLFTIPKNKFCSLSCSKEWQGSEEYQSARRQALFDKYGVINTSKLDHVKKKMSSAQKKNWQTRGREILEAMQETCKKNHGVASPQQSETVRAKAKASMVERYGVEHAQQSKDIRKKTVMTNLKKFGTRTAMQNPDVRAQVRATCMERYGVPVSLMADEVRSKSAKTYRARRTFTTATGLVLSLQGYEPYVAAWLESRGFTVDSAERLRIHIPYRNKDQQRYYFPDLCAKSKSGTKYLVEVKSTWWVTQKGVLNKFKYAQLASEERGWGDYVLVVWCKKAGEPVQVFKGRKGYAELKAYLA